MKKKRTLQKVTMTTGVVVMSVGLFNSFNLDAQTTGGGSCSGTSVTVSCYDAENWQSESNPGWMYGRVCDNEKCARAWFQYMDGEGTCSYCNE